MIQPNRYTNPELSVVNICALILRESQKAYIIGYDELLEKVIRTIGEGAKENYPYALNLLFLLGKIEYIEENDSFRYHEAK